MKNKKTFVLSGDDVNAIVENYGLDRLMDVLIDRLTNVILAYDPKKIEIPIRSGFNYNSDIPGLIEWMPVHRKGNEIVIKVVGYHPKNPSLFKLPTILSSISSYDTKTGHLNGIIDGVLLTALRTGAASAIASKFLASPDSSVLGLIGCGAQSVTQLHAISRLFKLNKILIFDSDTKAINSFEDRCSMLGITADIVPATIEEIVKNCDIVCTSTSIAVGAGPLFDDLETNSQLHINAIGSDFPGKIELPLSFLKQSLVCPDFLEQAKIEGECQQLKNEEIGPDLVDLAQNSASYAYAKSRRTVFDSTGWAMEDQVVMGLFLDLANEFGIGLEIAIENIPEDAKNPYHFLLKTVQI
ncbi:MAG: ornithine cyclodeaminase family protein [Flavobacteriaceae bacterium]